ncbi:MAG: HEAT repeat domain-containing protein [Planctomycetota bacterium]|jgi:hypothetical protein
MSGNRDTTTDGIELHFCRDCGISIPIADIESGRANPALPGCAYGMERCSHRKEAPEVAAPTAARPVRTAPDGGGGMRIVLALALLYVVGTTTFLLFREVQRKPPEIRLPSDVAMVRDIRDLGRKLEAVDEQAQRALEQLKSNDSLQATTLSGLRQRIHELGDALRRTNDSAQERDREVARGLLSLTEEVMGLKTPLGDIMMRLDKLGDGAARPQPETTVRKKTTQPDKNEPTEDPKLRAQVEDFIKQLGDRAQSDQNRYNAAVQLGDLGHPAAVTPLMTALQKDPYDLVRRAAAFSLGMLGKHAVPAIPVLIEGVSKQEEYVGYMCARALGEIAKATLGQTVEFGYDPTMSRKQRNEVRDKWNEWWEKNKALVETQISD